MPTPQTKLSRGLNWLGVGTKVAFRGTVDLVLENPLIYVFQGANGTESEEPAAIDPRLAVAANACPASAAVGLPYWPRFAGLTSAQRRYYLSWLAQRQTSFPVEMGYAFLFIYGLERRALIDKADQDVIFREITRLRKLYVSSGTQRSRSFESYTANFLWFLLVQSPRSCSSSGVKELLASSEYLTDQQLASILYWFAATRPAIPDWAVLRIAGALPASHRSAVTARVNDQFTRLFLNRFSRSFPEGFRPTLNHHRRNYSFRPSSAALTETVAVAPDPLGEPSHYAPLSDIWNECISELRKLSTVVSKENGVNDDTAKWEATPDEIRNGTLHPLTDAFCKLIETRLNAAGIAIVKAAELTTFIGLEAPVKMTLSQCKRLSKLAGWIGYALDPDPFFTNRSWKPDQHVAAFLRLFDDEPEATRLHGAACMLQIGIAIAHADGTPTESAIAAVVDHVATLFELTSMERRRLEAVAAVLTITGVELSTVTRLLGDLTVVQREKIAKLTLVLAATDNIITTAELRIIRRVYAKLGYSAQEIDHSLAAIRGDDDEPTTVVRAHKADPGEEIPRPHAAPSTLHLDREAIAKILQETRDVADLLGAAMNLSHDEHDQNVYGAGRLNPGFPRN